MLECGIILQLAFHLVWRQVFVATKPIAYVPLLLCDPCLWGLRLRAGGNVLLRWRTLALRWRSLVRRNLSLSLGHWTRRHLLRNAQTWKH